MLHLPSFVLLYLIFCWHWLWYALSEGVFFSCARSCECHWIMSRINHIKYRTGKPDSLCDIVSITTREQHLDLQPCMLLWHTLWEKNLQISMFHFCYVLYMSVYNTSYQTPKLHSWQPLSFFFKDIYYLTWAHSHVPHTITDKGKKFKCV